MEYSPALSVSSDLTDEELDLYFAQCAPLSHLPTPPTKVTVRLPTANTRTAVPRSSDEVETKTPELEAHAIHLSKFIPSNVSTQAPSISAISDFLLRAKLPIEIVAFAACILDALSHRFASSWRNANLPAPTPFKYIPLVGTLRQSPPVGSEVIVLAALSLAHGWLEDRPKTNSHWASIEGGDRFTIQQVENARACILKDVDYGLFRINEEMVHFMTEEMQRATKCSLRREKDESVIGRKGSVADAQEKDKRPKLSLDMHGTAIWVHGMATPEPSP